MVAIIRQSKKLHYQRYFTENATDIRKTWRGIKSILNIRNSNQGQPTSTFIDKEISTDPPKITQGFKLSFQVSQKICRKRYIMLVVTLQITLAIQ